MNTALPHPITGCLAGLLLAVTAASVPMPTQADTPPLLRMFQRSEKVAADPATKYELSEIDGPWMILAHTFLGEGSRGRADKLVLEIRRDLNLPAYVYEEKFDFTGKVELGDPVRPAGYGGSHREIDMRYANQVRYSAHAVLVGEYDSVDHPRIDDDLNRVKAASSSVLGDAKEMEAETDLRSPVTTIKAIHNQLLKRRKDNNGPMASAFVTRNPMLPEDYFQAPEVDSFVQQLNEDKPHSLLDCQGKYTVIVRTFEGLGAIVGGKSEQNFKPSIERLDDLALQAAKMTAGLRAEGHEAYQYHDRNKSIVTIGSFESLGRELPGGRFEYDPAILRVMNEFRAFNVDPNIARQVNGRAGQGAMATNHRGNVPFDVQPTPIAVPRAAKRKSIGFMGR